MPMELIVTNDITINAPITRVWKALVDPEKTKKYMFGCEAVSDWKVGSPLIWKGVWDNKEMIAVKGTVLRFQPFDFLAYTTFDPNNTAIEDIPENYLTVTYSLTDNEGKTNLNVTQGDYAKVADGQKRYDEAMNAGGWESILAEIKKLVESN